MTDEIIWNWLEFVFLIHLYKSISMDQSKNSNIRYSKNNLANCSNDIDFALLILYKPFIKRFSQKLKVEIVV